VAGAFRQTQKRFAEETENSGVAPEMRPTVGSYNDQLANPTRTKPK
jgi:hypothetical protein